MAPNLEPVSAAELERLAGFRGELLRPADPGYEEHRLVWNQMFDARPALLARCAGVADVREAVGFARDTGRLLAVRGGGHSLAGKGSCEDAVVVDLAPMNHARVDPQAGTMRIEGGATWSDFDREARAFGLAAPTGAISMTGVGGVTLGGGFGWLGRRFGMCCDNVRSMDVVTAAGEVVVAAESENPDLFWALRGGGGNFGVVTSFEFELHRINPSVLTGVIGWPLERAAEVLEYYAPIAPNLPREIGLNAQLVIAPAEPDVPEHLHGEPILILIYAYHGDDHAEGLAAMEPLRRFGEPAFDTTAAVPYEVLQTSNDARCPVSRSYWQCGYLDDLRPAIEQMIERFRSAPGPLCLAEFLTMSGAIADQPDDATAIRRRDGWVYNVISMWFEEAEDEANVAWARKYHEAMRPFASEGAYINFFSEGDDHRVAEAYGEEKLARLAAIKRRYDPENLFSVNHNIEPEEV